MDAEYARDYRRLYEQHWWWRAREVLLLRVIRRLLAGRGRASILDVGCGDGLFFERLLAFGEVSGVEPDLRTLDPAGRHAARIYRQPFDEAFSPGTRYDLILLLDVLEHLPDPVEALRRAGQLLADRGQVLITVPAFNWLWTAHDRLNEHLTRYNRRTLRRVIDEGGLRAVSQRYFFQWLVPLKLGVRWSEALFGERPRPPTVPRPLVNRTLYGLSVAEQQVLGRIPLPFGSSLLAVAARPD